MAPEHEKSGYYGRATGPKPEEPQASDSLKASEPDEVKPITLEEFVNSKACDLLPGFCDIVKQRLAQADEVTEVLAPKSVGDYFLFSVKGLYDPKHPEAVIGEIVTMEEVNRYKEFKRKQVQEYNLKHPKNKKPVKYGVKEMADYLGKNVGKVGIWQIDQAGFSNLLSVSKFLSGQVDSACNYAGLGDGCILYHIISFENSGSLWRGSLAKNPADVAAGPAQIMSGWYTEDWANGLDDGLTTQNFFRVISPYTVKNSKGKPVQKTYYHYDGRFDPVANLEFGARTMRNCLDDYGHNHPDFAVLAHNQGSTASKVLKEWAKRNMSVDYDDFFDSVYRKMSRPKPKPYAAFLDYLADKRGGKEVTVAEILLDTSLSDKYFSTDNGGKGYISKILAMNELMTNGPEKYDIHMSEGAGAFPALLQDGWKVEYQWEELFESAMLPKTKSLREYASGKKIDFYTLVYLNQHIRDPEYKFDREIRVWLPKKNTPVNYLKGYADKGKVVYDQLMKLKSEYASTLNKSSKSSTVNTGSRAKSRNGGRRGRGRR